MAEFEIRPTSTALLIIDMTNAFIAPGAPIMVPAGLGLIPGLNKLMRSSRKKGIKVIFTTHVYRKDGSNLGIHPAFHPELVDSDVTREGSDSIEFYKDLQPAQGDIIIRKPRFDAFIGTDLELILRASFIDTLIIGGVLTNVCCESTARHARMLDFKVIFLADGTATVDMPDSGWGKIAAGEVQRYTLAIMDRHFGQVSTIANVIERIEHSA